MIGGLSPSSFSPNTLARAISDGVKNITGAYNHLQYRTSPDLFAAGEAYSDIYHKLYSTPYFNNIE
jgi:hypothetical protein